MIKLMAIFLCVFVLTALYSCQAEAAPADGNFTPDTAMRHSWGYQNT